MFRIRVASNGYYYVQEQLSAFHWSRCSPFFRNRTKAERFVKMNRKCKCVCCICGDK